ncbi:MAG: hypothetical protein AAF809_00485 [Bacteroidota bacterium]
MPEWVEVYDNEDVLVATRERVGRLTVLTALFAGALLSFAPLLVLHTEYGLLWVGLASALFFGGVGWAALDYLHQRCVVWCVKLSMKQVVGYDYARRTLHLAWPDVARIELDADGLLIVGRGPAPLPTVLKIPHQYPDFAALSHRVVEYAEAHRVEVHVDGQPLDTLDVASVFGVEA